MFNLFKKKMKKGCPACNKEKTFAFSEDLIGTRYKANIEKVDAIGTTNLYRCSDCNTDYFKEKHMYNKLTKNSKELLVKFYKRDLVLNKKLKEQIDQIGITKDWNSDKLIPAKIELNNGMVHDFARIRISKNPPMGYYYDLFETVIYIDEVKSINDSEFSLSKEIRDKSKNAEELRMSFYPTVLKTVDNIKVVINSLTLFFDSQNIKGTELSLANELWDFKYDKYIYATETNTEVLVIIKE